MLSLGRWRLHSHGKSLNDEKEHLFFQTNRIMTNRNLSLALLLLFSLKGWGQDNYEIQVYDSKLVPQGMTMVELHSNFAINGLKDTVQGVLPTNHALHETIEITHGFCPWLEIGFYQFLTRNDAMKPAYVGNHIRPRIAVPEKYKLPVGLSLSAEFGYQVSSYSSDTWTLEIRPIIDKTFGKIYIGINPVLDYSFAGANAGKGAVLSPNVKFSVEAAPKVKVGLEYYNSMGPFGNFEQLNQQPHQLALAFDFDFSPEWELNIGYVKGLTTSVEADIFKVIIGRRFGKTK
jgi:hypothetical protein